jgi:hypothetical protein
MGKRFSSLRRLAPAMVLAASLYVGPAALPVQAADLPMATASPLAGIGFDDRPLFLPVQRNFQMAMLTAGTEIGRSCGKMEAYGWRMSQSEQGRVNQIFNSSVDRLRGMGYVIEMQTPNSVSKDVTMFTADRSNKHLLFMWSAGEIGLVMTLCETGAPPMTKTATGVSVWPSVQTFPQDVVQSKLDNNVRPASIGKPEEFSPLGEWTGSYVCSQGYTGATLTISKIKGSDFQGDFHFFPTSKNKSVPEGRYAVYGQYDADSRRILINPGSWIQHPADFYNTIMVGSFDPLDQSFSAYFQGITGCTSFEARLVKVIKPVEPPKKKLHKHMKKKPKKIIVTKTAPFAAAASTTSGAPAPAVVSPAPSTASGLVVGAPTTGAGGDAIVAPSAPAAPPPPAPAETPAAK